MPTGIVKVLLEKIELHKMPVSELAMVAGLEGIRNASKTKLNEYFRDAAPMPNETAERLWSLWAEIEALALSVAPLTLDLRDGARVHEWLTKRRRDELLSFVWAESQ